MSRECEGVSRSLGWWISPSAEKQTFDSMMSCLPLLTTSQPGWSFSVCILPFWLLTLPHGPSAEAEQLKKDLHSKTLKLSSNLLYWTGSTLASLCAQQWLSGFLLIIYIWECACHRLVSSKGASLPGYPSIMNWLPVRSKLCAFTLQMDLCFSLCFYYFSSSREICIASHHAYSLRISKSFSSIKHIIKRKACCSSFMMFSLVEVCKFGSSGTVQDLFEMFD